MLPTTHRTQHDDRLLAHDRRKILSTSRPGHALVHDCNTEQSLGASGWCTPDQMQLCVAANFTLHCDGALRCTLVSWLAVSLQSAADFVCEGC